jgi:hypothetical protein
MDSSEFLAFASATKWTSRFHAFKADLIDKLRRDPIYLNRERLLDSRQELKIQTAMDVIAEQRAFAVNMLFSPGDADGGMEFTVDSQSVNADADLGCRFLIANLLLAAQPVLWPDEFRVAAAGSAMPDGGIDLAPTYLSDRRNPLWFTWPEDLALDGDDLGHLGLLIASTAQLAEPMRSPGLIVAAILNPTKETAGAKLMRCSILTHSLPNHVDTDDGLEASVKMIAFLDSPFIPQELRQVERPLRKRSPIKPPAVRFITLRKAMIERPTDDPEPSAEDEPRHRDWRCRWLVSGHFRAQPYPSTGERRLLWIAPHIKGPPDKPLKAPSAKAYKVNR